MEAGVGTKDFESKCITGNEPGKNKQASGESET